MSKALINIRTVKMSEEMQREALQVTLLAFQMYDESLDIAQYITKEFDRKFKPNWNCIVGTNFGSYVHHETNCFISFSIDKKEILLFKGC